MVVDEVRGAVDRIDEPLVARRTAVCSTFLTDDGIIRPSIADALDDHRLGGPIELGDDVGGR